MRDQAMHLPRQRRLVATTDSDHDESLFLERSRKLEVNVPNQLWCRRSDLIREQASKLRGWGAPEGSRHRESARPRCRCHGRSSSESHTVPVRRYPSFPVTATPEYGSRPSSFCTTEASPSWPLRKIHRPRGHHNPCPAQRHHHELPASATAIAAIPAVSVARHRPSG